MRSNLPVTQNEVKLTDAILIVSKTDLQGRITYINKDFLEISGFTEAELIGQPHNIVRHPDMPIEAFEDMWRDLKAGRPWTGLVKNRCKNGDYYWVMANAAPIWENSQVTGYMSVRRKAAGSVISEVEAIYRQFREKRQGHLRIQHGQAVSSGRQLANWWRDATVFTRLAGSFGLILLMGLLVGGVALLTMTGLRAEFDRYANVTVSKERLSLKGNIQVGNAVHYFKNTVIRGGDYPEKFLKEMDAIEKTVNDYRALGTLADEETKLLQDVSAGTKAYRGAIQEAVAQRATGKSIADIDRAIKGADKPLAAAFARMAEFNVEKSVTNAKKFEQLISDAFVYSAALLTVMVLVSMLALVMLVRGIKQPIDIAVETLNNVSQGNYSNVIDVSGSSELGKMLQGLQSMQTRLGFEVAETRRQADETLRIKIALDGAAMPITISDTKGSLIYLNGAAHALWGAMGSTICVNHAGFNVDAMIGTNLVDYFDDEATKTAYRAQLDVPKTFDVNMGGKVLRVTAAPVRDKQGAYLGRASQWLDRTNEVMVEKEVAGIVDGALRGDFLTRLSLEGKEGFFKQLSEGLNQLSETTQAGLSDVARILQLVAVGDLTQKIEADYQGIFGQLKDDTNSTIERLREVVGRIKEATEAINTASQEIAAGNQDLSSRTEEQASSLEETSSSMEELNATVKQNADNAQQANELAKTSNAGIVNGGQVVKQVVVTMGEIQTSSKKIADIIGVIDSIAFQTNILALNAAVEAARAGEQGRGFAVVATEVRNLAQRSATAAKEIKTLIAESVGKVESGAKLAQQAGTTMDEVVTSFQQVVTLVTEIASASREQSLGIEQTTQAVSQMDEVTQQNAALVEEAAAAAESLEEQAHGLVKTVSMFKLNEGGGRRSLANLPGPVLRDATPRQLPWARTPANLGSPKKIAPPHHADAGDQWEEF
jgi:methyl-accepting chemotaxis protein